VEGCVLALIFKYIITLKPEILIKLNVFSEDQIARAHQDDEVSPAEGRS
jgi:cobalt/nickel transport system permease protein